MQVEKSKQKDLYCLIPEKKEQKYISNIMGHGRYLIGRTESCDIIIPSTVVSSVHAVLEITPQGNKIYDMNSRNGTWLNGKKIVAESISLDDTIAFGNLTFKLRPYTPTPELPPVLDALEPISGDASLLKRTDLPITPKLSEEQVVEEHEVPYIVYPLSADPKSDYSEYIFEDEKELYPIFKYELNKQAIEIIILFRDKVYSVDYLPDSDGTYKIAGVRNKKDDVEFPYLAKNEEIPFIEVHKGNCNVSQLHNYELFHLSNQKMQDTKQGIVNLQEHDIVKLTNGELEIYIRKVAAPPKVKPAPFFRRDKELKKYILLMLFIVALFWGGLNFLKVDEKLDNEKDPERIATILYKQKLVINKNKTVESTKKKPVKKQKAPKKPVVKKTEPKKTQASSTKSNIKTTKKTSTPGSKKATKQVKVKRVKKAAPKKRTPPKKTISTNSAATKSVSKTQTRRANVVRKSKGRVDVYKSFDFKSSISNIMAKSGSLKGAKTATSSTTNLNSASVSGGVATNLQKADIGTEVGSLTGSTVGKLAESKGTEGLSAKTGVYTAGIPSETIVLGSMDPDVIRKILRDNIPFFRSCYQKELNARGGKDISGTIRLVFTIGASGHVSRAGVDGQTRLPGKVKGCVVNVLRGIKFPRPLGGGTVDVKQPFNFMPKRI